MERHHILVWDLPTRLFHWSLVGLFMLSWWSGEQGGTAFRIHQWSGYGILSLVLFRLVWGLVGGEYARFAQFVHGPRRVLRGVAELLRPGPLAQVGHNPVGGWMVVALLFGLLVQTVTGLFANDDIMNEGPLVAHIGKDLSDTLSGVHGVNFVIVLVLVSVHVLAIVYHRLRKGEHLTQAMITGRRMLPAPATAPRTASSWLALVLLALAAGMVALLINL